MVFPPHCDFGARFRVFVVVFSFVVFAKGNYKRSSQQKKYQSTVAEAVGLGGVGWGSGLFHR